MPSNRRIILKRNLFTHKLNTQRYTLVSNDIKYVRYVLMLYDYHFLNLMTTNQNTDDSNVIYRLLRIAITVHIMVTIESPSVTTIMIE